MAVLTGNNIVERARIVLSDVAGIRWTDPEMLGWINDGRRAIAAVHPEPFNALCRRTLDLDPGAYQNLSGKAEFADMVGFRGVLHNVKADGSIGKAVLLGDMGALDAFRPNWRTEKSSEVDNWSPDPVNMYAFWIYPHVVGGKLSVNITVLPSELSALTQVVVPLDSLFNPLLNYVLHRAYAKDAETAQSLALSASYLALFSSELGITKE